MSDESQSPSAPEYIPRLERIGFVMFLSWVLMVAVLAFEPFCRDSLSSRGDSFWLAALLFYGGLAGTVLWVYQIILPTMAIYGFGSLRQWSQRNKCRLVWLVVALVVIYQLWVAVSWKLMTCEPSRFTDITSMKWPATATCVKALHGFGLQDRRHLWIFEGTPEEFKSHKVQLPWAGGPATEESLAYIGGGRLPLAEVESAFQSVPPWRPAEVYNWMLEKDSEPIAPGVYGPAWLFVNAEHTRWCVWWNGI